MPKIIKLSKYDIADRIKALDIPEGADVEVFGPLIIEAFRGTELFLQFDESWSYMDPASGGRFWMVRTTRNSPVWGPALFAANAKQRKRAA